MRTRLIHRTSNIPDNLMVREELAEHHKWCGLIDRVFEKCLNAWF